MIPRGFYRFNQWMFVCSYDRSYVFCPGSHFAVKPTTYERFWQLQSDSKTFQLSPAEVIIIPLFHLKDKSGHGGSFECNFGDHKCSMTAPVLRGWLAGWLADLRCHKHQLCEGAWQGLAPRLAPRASPDCCSRRC